MIYSVRLYQGQDTNGIQSLDIGPCPVGHVWVVRYMAFSIAGYTSGKCDFRSQDPVVSGAQIWQYKWDAVNTFTSKDLRAVIPAGVSIRLAMSFQGTGGWNCYIGGYDLIGP